VDSETLAKSEKADFESGVQKLANFQELHGFMQNMSLFLWEWRTLYLQITRENSVPNFWNRRSVPHRPNPRSRPNSSPKTSRAP
jgi:hypothetical protein